ncbi:hypothetical protein [Loigolactobacillus jiayinensis]|uniref:Ethanolamine utilization protein n=1 Tax=Loigolactobacillus jiayinensis TaxID=2486016 RepID=A0ABW1RDB3_9LACO|nr:hypothetical protein [Loigolactobacillus jiayinensis]
MQTTEIDSLIYTVTERVWKILLKQADLPSVAFENTESAYPNSLLSKLFQGSRLTFYADIKVMEQADLLCVSVISQQQMIAIANLQSIDPISSVIIARILADKPVIICRNIDIPVNLHYGVKQQLQYTQKQLVKYGIVYMSDKMLLKRILAKLLTKRFSSDDTISFITVSALDKYLQDGKLKLPNNARLTPLAKDAARDQHLI